MLFAIPFFYLEFKAPYMISSDKLEDVVILMAVVGALYMIVGYQSRISSNISAELVGTPIAPKKPQQPQQKNQPQGKSK